MSTRQIATSTLWQIASQVTMAALSIVTLKLVSISLSTSLLGNYNSAYGFLQIFGILADFGLYAVSVKELSRVEDKGPILSTLIALRSIILVISFGLALGIVWTAPQWRGTVLPLGVTIAALVPIFTLLAGTLRVIFQVHYRMHFVFIAEVVQRIVTVSLIAMVPLIFGITQSSDPLVYQWFLLVGGIGALVLLLFSLAFGLRVMPFKFRTNRDLLKKYFLLAAPYGLAFLCTALYRQTDVTMIAALRPDYDIQNAYYGAVQRMADMAYLIPTFLLNSVLPILSERDSKGEDTRQLLGKTFFILLLLGTCSLLFSLLWARPLVRLLTVDSLLSTADHPGADTALQLIALPMFLNGIILFSFYVLLTRHAWRRLLMTLAGGALLSIGVNLWLIPAYGFVGAGITSIVTHLFLAALLLPQSLRVMPVRLSMLQLGQWLAFGLLLAGFLVLAQPFLDGWLTTMIGLGLAGAWLVAISEGLRIRKGLS